MQSALSLDVGIKMEGEKKACKLSDIFLIGKFNNTIITIVKAARRTFPEKLAELTLLKWDICGMISQLVQSCSTINFRPY